METRAELIVEIREKFFKKLEEEGPSDPRGFHPADIDRIKYNDDWLKRFLEHNENDLQESLSMLWESCTWRRKVGANDISEDNVKKDYLEEGVIFSYGKDKDGKTLFIVRSKLHVKGAKDFGELQRCIIYWFERLEREGNGNQISIFFDMAETGLSNMDMELTKYLIGLFKSYYPNFLNYIIIFEMPWVLNAAFKIIKSWLPAKAIPKIKFVNKSNLKDFVDPNDILKYWGGTNDYTFTFVSEERTSTENAINNKLDNKKVHFVESSPLTEQPPSGFGDQVSEEQLLLIEPEAVTFNKEGNEIVGRIILKNVTTDKPLSYKIKTTSPQKFRVRPSSGIISPSERCSVTVVFQPGYNLRGLSNNDRFLVMCLPVKNAAATAQELTTIWKSGKPAEQHRLRCCDGANENNEVQKTYSILSSGSIEENRTIDTLCSKVIHLEENCNKLYKELKYLQIFSIILTVLMAIAVIYILRSDIQNADLENCHIHRGI
ncbi:motile sperm domain-containing protein 2-like [Vespula maculifrons]|uniref:Motile sperm domain-containing protein 2 n=3 Tax=Vespula TaxID=7451 RepID=A0A834JL75_VESGE|nr:motile sperm domain-containing protein 2-like [Vespula pensylvanica]XP_050861190.1 motile sperm domain-containing protein 2-like [Vespula vulgaris]KAF7385774.1 hypothetical protein HZH66_011616 [Vespula vulgaris]KAF7387421.1 hypothetical protein HZH68_013098 [Vespula germanica]